MNASAGSYLSLERSSCEPAVRLALVYDSTREPAALVSILTRQRVPPDAGVLPVSRVEELTQAPPEATVAAARLDPIPCS